MQQAFDLARKVRDLGPKAREVARTGGCSRPSSGCTGPVKRRRFIGLKPAGLDVGPIIPAAEQAFKSGSPARLCDALCGIVRDQIAHRHAHAAQLKQRAGEGVPAAREYRSTSETMLGLQMWAHGVYRQTLADSHSHVGAHEHE